MGDVEDPRLGSPRSVDQLGDGLLGGARGVGEEGGDVQLHTGQGLHQVKQAGAQVGALPLKKNVFQTWLPNWTVADSVFNTYRLRVRSRFAAFQPLCPKCHQ